MNKPSHVTFGVLVSALLGWGMPAAAIDFPTRPVEFVISAGTGGGIDTTVRFIAGRLQQKWGKPVIVVNKPGGNNAIAEGYVANAAADGHTVLFTNQTRTLNAAEDKKQSGYDMVNAFAAVTQIGSQPFILVANKDFPAKTLPELVALAKSKPNKVNYGDSGARTPGDLATKRLMQKTGMELFEIPYKTNAEVLIALFSGEIDVEFGSMLTTAPHIKAGKATALALADDVRSPVLPDVPTIKEAMGLDSFVYTSWYGVFVPAKTPKEVINYLNEEIVAIVRSPEVSTQLANEGFTVVANKSDEFEKSVKEEAVIWRSVIEAFPAK